MDEGVTFTAELWRWTARKESADSGAWCFVTLPVDLADELRERAGEPRGFGSVRVRARVGSTTWDTSVFPDAGLRELRAAGQEVGPHGRRRGRRVTC